MSLELSRVHWPITNLGPGSRIGLWFQGCDIGCSGCIARDTWPVGGHSWSVAGVLRLVHDLLLSETIEGVTISGGEPFQQARGLQSLVRAIRKHFAALDILVFSGYSWKRLQRDFVDLTLFGDGLVAGPYVESQADHRHWCGSRNQTFHALTPLGVEVLQPWIETPSNQPVQVKVDGSRLWAVGIPQPGQMAQLADGLERLGVALDSAAWFE